uniref:Enkurin domain-containing protein n=1 Tax=Palpitomonas bilix TaxID=652834 RepID=A0A7S3CY94_9EUKA|mmetsp:Transcript_14569/g.37175  ORF Transcript_14569/g.37175 Transcript_14569/m.37175 type:complete len:235 (+) Transcript_14569:128-832(+)|eukprot:CAMPEP_0113868746 /NCGR_PEP_ID=MMETSP0780_2-20120614/1160_1 /TAXON_ID=652834 /ORGANISM="Palpitomonas bilix" /LENGTH=234 /DNA_ID=CAMNT_0000853863 /DNA_START=91 /DNA_END=795 /DNA_ORIENTATION=- /assembly_acc=CAM_ASM_000599
MDESIYNLIPKPVEAKKKPAMYKSQHHASYTTKQDGSKAAAATMGPAKVAVSKPTEYLKKHEKEPNLPEPRKFERPTQKKPSVPRAGDKPVMGVKSKKDFITANAVENILAIPKKSSKQDLDYTKKKDFGKIPAYLDKVKQDIQEEYRMVQDMEGAEEMGGPNMVVLPEQERLAILRGLKTNWERINKQYQTLSFTLDTPAKRARKEAYEAQLEQIERDIQKLSKKNVFVAADY